MNDLKKKKRKKEKTGANVISRIVTKELSVKPDKAKLLKRIKMTTRQTISI